MKALLYDLTFRRLTTDWYREVLGRLPRGSHLLDVGIGTAGALIANASLLRERDLRITGVDIDPSYVRRAQRRVASSGLSDRVCVQLESIDRHAGTTYDAAYFSASFMLLPAPVATLRHVTGLLTRPGSVFFTQTFENRRSALVEKTKPLLKAVTTIDFGRVTYLEEFLDTLRRGGVEIAEVADLKAGRARTFRLIEARYEPEVRPLARVS